MFVNKRLLYREHLYQSDVLIYFGVALANIQMFGLLHA